MENKLLIIQTRVYQGELKKDENNEWKTRNWVTKTPRPSTEWDLFLKHGAKTYSKIEVEGVLEQTIEFGTKKVKGHEVPTQKHVYKSINIPEEVKAEVASIFVKKVEQTPEQKQIAELNAKIEMLMADKPSAKDNGKPKGKPKGETEIKDVSEIATQYKELVGQDPHKSWDDATTLGKIEEFKAAQSGAN